MFPLVRPFVGDAPVTQAFGPSQLGLEPPWLEWPHFHRGVDYGCAAGTRVYASAEGHVIWAGWDGAGFGYTVVVDHGEGLHSRLAHLSRIDVRSGQRVTSTTALGLSGSSGNSTGPHLHWEVTCYGAPVHPWYYVEKRISA